MNKKKSGVIRKVEDFKGSTKLKRIINHAIENKRFNHAKKIVDIGCGLGEQLYLVNQLVPSASVINCDIDPEIIKLGKKKYPDIEFKLQSADDIDFDDKSVDIIICSNLIEHVNNPEKVLSEIQRVLKDDGLLLIDFPNGYCMGELIFRLGGKFLHGKSSHLKAFTYSGAINLLSKNNLYINEEIHCLGYGPYIHHRIYKTLFRSKHKGISALINQIFFKLKIKYKVEFLISKIPHDNKITNKYVHYYNIDEPYKISKVE